MARAFLLRFVALFLVLAFPAAAAEAEWMQAVAQALGKSGTAMPGGVYRVGLARSDLKVTLDGVAIKPALALGGWLAFTDRGGRGAVMGDLVLLDTEVNAVMKKLGEAGIEITALHNHLLRNQPFTMYLHVMGHGEPAKLASALHEALAQSATPLGEAKAAGGDEKPDLDTAAIDRALGHKGKASGGVYQVSIPRAEKIREAGMDVPPAMGVATGINFQAAGAGQCATTGDFVLTADEVNPVVKALRANGIEVTALHNHMLTETPRLFFLHFWAHGETSAILAGLEQALAHVKSAKG